MTVHWGSANLLLYVDDRGFLCMLLIIQLWRLHVSCVSAHRNGLNFVLLKLIFFDFFALLGAALSMQHAPCVVIVFMNHPRIWSRIKCLKTNSFHVTNFSKSVSGVLTRISWNANCNVKVGNQLLNSVTLINYVGAFRSLNEDSSSPPWLILFIKKVTYIAWR